MAWNPFDHLYELAIRNTLTASPYPDPWPTHITFHGGQVIPAAVPGRPETVTFWLADGGTYHQITREQAFAQELWLRFSYDAPAPAPDADDAALVALGWATDFRITQAAMREAVLSMPHILETIAEGGYSEADVWSYTQHEAPWAVDLVGVPPA